MKALYIGVYKDGTGWGKAAQDYILSLDAAGIEVVPRALKLNNRQTRVPDRILELERQSDKNCDVVIQHVLPHHMDYSGHFGKNIGLYVSETSHFCLSSWPIHLNAMDDLWVPNSSMAKLATKSNIKHSPHIVPHATDTEKFLGSYEYVLPEELKDRFVFYFIGEAVARKNLKALLIAFHSEFDGNENVGLLIKSTIPGLNDEQAKMEIEALCAHVKDSLKIFPSRDSYIEETIITEYMSEEELMNIHFSCDCFVMPSYGEAWCIPAFDAMGMGKTPIVNNAGGMCDFIDDSVGALISNREEPVFGMLETFADIYTGAENWWSIDILELRKKMREAYESDWGDKSEAGFDRAFEFSYYNVGKTMEEALNA